MKDIRRGQIWRLEEPDGSHVTVALTDHGHAIPRAAIGSLRSWNGMVVESTHPSYPVGGYDISVTADDIERKGRRVDLVAVFALFQDALMCDGSDAWQFVQNMNELGWEDKL